ncbi:MFS transporter [Streptomyces sp. APSN-46.1]|uniref:MFS transporter n=1 Tax=Streptomyces sp. APSN-46.1 TaxID=2929049 RepID=UPI001FB4FA2E|nr:MFS transporter [Streptomyces sp. APSN-46.1]MCJ1678511.1 MFS transporter [Streptomyces sp. APSN-46.1]
MSVADVARHETGPPGPPGPLRKNREFLLLWSGAGMSFLGTRVTTAAYPLIVLWHTDSPLAMSAVAFAALLPLLLVQLPAGAMVDRWDRRKVMLACEAGRVLAVGTVAAALATGRVWVVHLAVVAFVEASFAVFYRLAERGAVRNLVHPDHLSTALSQNEARGRAAGLLGQPGGILLQSLVRWAPFLFSAVAYTLSLLSLLLIRKDFQGKRQTAGAPKKLVGEVAEGLRWLWKRRFMRAVLGCIAATNILFTLLGMAMIVLVKEQGRSPSWLAVIMGISGVGGILGALAAGRWLRDKSLGSVMVRGITGWALLMGAMYFVRNPVLLGFLYAGAASVGAAFNVVAAVYQVRATPDELQGRVAATGNLIGSGTNSLGALLGGVLLAGLGAGPTIAVVGVSMAALAVFAAVGPVRKGERADDLTDFTALATRST